MGSDAQTFWLDHLQQADQYNQWIFAQIRPHLNPQVLEIGCGNGTFTTLLAQQATQVVGVDLDADYVQAAQRRLQGIRGVELICGDATLLSYPERFGSIVMLDVLEHIEDDVSLLRQLGQNLQADGSLILKVPALQALYCDMDRSIGHYRRYNRTSLRQTLEAAGYRIRSLSYFNLVGILGWWLHGVVLKRTTPPAQQISWFNRLVPLMSWVESRLDPPIGLGLVAVASKS